MSKLPYRLGLKHDRPDSRDYHFRVQFRLPSTLPPSVDLTSKCPPPLDQGNLGSCTANALAKSVAFLEGNPSIPLSRLFIYWNERNIEGTTSGDDGAELRDGIKSLADQGVCREDEWPYDISQFATKPQTFCYQDALQHTITQYHRLDNLQDMKACLAMGFPFPFGTDLFSSAMADDVAATGIIPMPSLWERIKGPVGGHALLACGFDDSTGLVKFSNSWVKPDGVLWGDQGYGTLKYDYVQSYVSDAWVVLQDANPVFASLPAGMA
jgi:C1A family cysteine protease